MTHLLSIGDEVVVTVTGKRFKISEVNWTGDLYSADGFPWYPASSLRLVEEPKIGHWVEVIGPCCCGRSNDVGHIFQISEFDKTPTGKIAFSAHNEYAYYPKSLRKLSDEEVKEHLSLKLGIGDWVELVQPNQWTDETISFKIGEISDIHGCSRNGKVWWPASSLRKLTPEEIQQHENTIFEKHFDVEKEENEGLSRRIAHLEDLELSETDKLELEFLRKAIKPYVVYSCEDIGYPGWRVEYAFHQKKTLQNVESDLTKARFYIAVLEAQMGPDGIEAAKKVCERLKAVCNLKAIEQAREA